MEERWSRFDDQKIVKNVTNKWYTTLIYKDPLNRIWELIDDKRGTSQDTGKDFVVIIVVGPKHTKELVIRRLESY